MATPISRYFELSGKWERYQSSWPKLRRLFSVCPRRCDWAVMGLDCMEYTINHMIDMGPDSWMAVVAFSKLAAAFGDRRTANLALCIAAKQAVALVTAFFRRDFCMKYINTWDWEKQVPESGWNESGHVIKAGYTQAKIIYNFLSGVVYSQEPVKLYRDYCFDKAGEFSYGWLEKYYPQWRDVTYKLPGKRLSLNNPNMICQIFQLREILGASNNELNNILVDGLAEKLDKPLWHYVACSSMPLLSMAANATMVGRDAPFRVGSCVPAALKSAKFDLATKTATVIFRSKVPFKAKIVTKRCPAEIQLNGSNLKPEEYSFDADRHLLSIPVSQTGKTEITLKYPVWKRPTRTARHKIVPQIKLTPEMKLCQNAKNKKTVANNDFQAMGVLVPVNIKPFCNMMLSRGPAADGPWFGQDSSILIPGSGISRILRGKQNFRRIPFSILPGNGKAAIGLYGSKAPKLPKKISGIKVGRKLKHLYFLHAAGYDSGDGSIVMEYVVNCKGGKKFTIPVRSGINIADWWTPHVIPGAKLISSVKCGNHPVGLYIMKWTNRFNRSVTGVIAEEQLDYYTIDSIEIHSIGKNGVCAVIAITGEEP